jgi:lipoprotein NlpD
LRISAPEDRSGVQVGSVRPSGEVEARPLGTGAAAPSAPSAPGPAAEGGLKTSPKALRLPYSEQNLALLSKPDARAEVKPEPKPEAKPAPVPPAPVPQAPERAADAIDFVWPAKGRVVAGFSEPRNKGVDIAANLGDPVSPRRRTRDLRRLGDPPGQVIVVRHENGFNTVYAHNRENLVKMDQNLTRGQKIAEVGNSDADTPKLHFQIRKFGTPLDPMKYLPPS